MIDTVKLRLPIMESNKMQIENLQYVLSQGSTTQYWNNGKMVDRGRLNFSDIIIGSANLYVRVSLPKFYFGNNIQSLTSFETEKAICMLSDTLGVDIGNASVCQLHIAHTFEMNNPPRMYYEYLGESPNLHRWNCTPETLYYVSTGKRKWKELYFYDKVRELKKGNTRGINDIGKILLRMELRFERSPHIHFRKKYLFIKDLAQPSFHRQCRELLVNHYNKINKCRPIVEVAELSKTATPKQVKDLLFVSLIQAAESDDPTFLERFHILAKKFAGFRTGESSRRLRPLIDKIIADNAVRDYYALERELTAKVNSLLEI